MSKRARKTAEAADSQHQPETAEGSQGTPNDPSDSAVDFDPAKLEAQTISTGNSPPSVPAVTMGSGQQILPKISDTLPDPRSVDQISLSEDRDGPKMRLLRSYSHHEVWIQFDKNPGKATTDQIKAAGFRWENRAEVNDKRGAWVKPLVPGREITSMVDAERFFKAVGNRLREEHGLGPVGMTGHGVG